MPTTPHVTDEELLLQYYGESSPADRARVSDHVAQCDACRTLDHELRAVLSLVDTAPLAEAPDGFERQMWARVQPHLGNQRSWTWRHWPAIPRLALAGGVAALIVAAFLIGRFSGTPLGQATRDEVASAVDVRERLLQTEVGDHLERSQRVLVELVNADVPLAQPFGGEQARAAELVAASRLYRRTAEESGDTGIRELLEDLERVLIEVANGPVDATPQELADLRARIDEQDLVFRLRVVAAEIRERERRQNVLYAGN